MYKGRSSERGSKSQSRTSKMQEKHSPELEEINMAKNKQNLLKEIKPEEIKPKECKKNKDCDPLNKDLLSISKYKYNCNNGICVKEKNNNKLRFGYRKDVRIFEKKKFDEGDIINDGSEFIKFNKFHKHKDKIYNFLENVKYLIEYNLIKYYDHNGLDDFFKKTLKLQKYVEDNLSKINNPTIEDGIKIYLSKFNIELEKLKKIENYINDIIDIIKKSDNEKLNKLFNSFDSLSLENKLIFLKTHKWIILTEINNSNNIDQHLIFKINSLLNPKNGGKLKKEKLKKEKLKKSDKKPNKKADKKTKKS